MWVGISVVIFDRFVVSRKICEERAYYGTALSVNCLCPSSATWFLQKDLPEWGVEALEGVSVLCNETQHADLWGTTKEPLVMISCKSAKVFTEVRPILTGLRASGLQCAVLKTSVTLSFPTWAVHRSGQSVVKCMGIVLQRGSDLTWPPQPENKGPSSTLHPYTECVQLSSR